MIPRLLGWSREEVDPELDKSFEVALHAGTALALLVLRRDELRNELANLDPNRVAFLVLSFAPAAAVGYLLERQIESRLGGPGSTAAGLLLGAVAMVLADTAPQRRSAGEARPVDGLALGLAQAAALMPGVSRNGATLTAARLARFTRRDANRLSRTVALPVIAGASLLKGVRLRRRGLDRRQLRWLAVGTVSSFVSTLVSNRTIELVERDSALLPYAAYRAVFAGLILTRLSPGNGADAVESPSQWPRSEEKPVEPVTG